MFLSNRLFASNRKSKIDLYLWLPPSDEQTGAQSPISIEVYHMAVEARVALNSAHWRGSLPVSALRADDLAGCDNSWDAGFEYQIHASLYPVSSKGILQDVLIGAYR